MAKLTAPEQIIAEKTVCILLVRGETPEKKKIYAYVAIRADKLESFMEAQKQGTFYPEDFGIVIESGEGEPSEEIKKKMTEEYGFNHEAMMDVGSPQTAHNIASNISSFVTGESDDKNE